MDIVSVLNAGGYVHDNPEYNPKTKKGKLQPQYIVNADPDGALNQGSALARVMNQEGRQGYNLDYLGSPEKYAEYDVTISPVDESLEKELARQQSNLSKFGNSISQTLISEIGLGTIKGFSDFADALGQLIGVSDGDYSNPLSAKLEEWQETFKNEVAPIYTEGKTIADGGLTDFGWWAENMPSIASSLTLLIPAAGITKGISMLGKLNKVQRATRGAVKFLTRSSRPSTYASAGRLFENGTTALLSRTMENYQEARGVYNDMRNQIAELSDEEFQDVVNRNQYQLEGVDTSDKEAVADAIAHKAATETFKDDYINVLFDVAQLYALRNTWKGLRSSRGSAALDRESRRVIQTAGMSADEIAAYDAAKSGAKKYFELAKDYAIGGYKTAAAEASEGVEEAINYIAQMEGMHVGNLMLGKDKMSTFDNRLKEYASAPQLWDSAFWGVMGGIAFQGLGSTFYRVQNKIYDGIANKENKNTGENKEEVKKRSWWMLDELPEIKRRRTNIQRQGERLNQFATDMESIKQGRDIYSEKENAMFDLSTESGRLNQELARERTINSFIDDLVMNAANNGNIDYLKAFMSSDEVRQAMVKKGVIKEEESKDFMTKLNNTIDEIDNMYGQEVEQLNSIAGSEEVDVPVEYLQIIANNNVQHKLNMKRYDEVAERFNTDVARVEKALSDSGKMSQQEASMYRDLVTLQVKNQELASLYAAKRRIEEDKDLSSTLSGQVQVDNLNTRIKSLEESLYDDTDSMTLGASLFMSTVADRTIIGDDGKLNIVNTKKAIKRLDDILAGNFNDFLKSMGSKKTSKDFDIDIVRNRIKTLQKDIKRVIGKDNELSKINPDLQETYAKLAAFDINKAYEQSMLASTVDEVNHYANMLNNTLIESRAKAIEKAQTGIIELNSKYKDINFSTLIDYANNREKFDEAAEGVSESDIEKLKDYIDVLNLTKSSNKELGAEIANILRVQEERERKLARQEAEENGTTVIPETTPASATETGENSATSQNQGSAVPPVVPITSSTQPLNPTTSPANASISSPTAEPQQQPQRQLITNNVTSYDNAVSFETGINEETGTLDITLFDKDGNVLTTQPVSEDVVQQLTQGNKRFDIHNPDNTAAGTLVTKLQQKSPQRLTDDEINNFLSQIEETTQEGKQISDFNKQQLEVYNTALNNELYTRQNNNKTSETRKLSIGDTIEIFSSEGEKQDDSVYTIANITSTSRGDRYNLQSVSSKKRVTVDAKDVDAQLGGKYKLLNPTTTAVGNVEPVSISLPTVSGTPMLAEAYPITHSEIKQGDRIAYSSPESGNVINYGNITTVQGDDVVMKDASGEEFVLPKDRTYYKLDLGNNDTTISSTGGENATSPIPAVATSETPATAKLDDDQVIDNISAKATQFFRNKLQSGEEITEDDYNAAVQEVIDGAENQDFAKSEAANNFREMVEFIQNSGNDEKAALVKNVVFNESNLDETSNFTKNYEKGVKKLVDTFRKDLGIRKVGGKYHISLEDLLRYCNSFANDSTIPGELVYKQMVKYLQSGKLADYVIDDINEAIKGRTFMDKVNMSISKRMANGDMNQRIGVQAYIDSVAEEINTDEIFNAIDNLSIGDTLTHESNGSVVFIKSNGVTIGILKIPTKLSPTEDTLVSNVEGWNYDVNFVSSGIVSRFKDAVVNIINSNSEDAKEILDVLRSLGNYKLTKAEQQEITDALKDNKTWQELKHDFANTKEFNDAQLAKSLAKVFAYTRALNSRFATEVKRNATETFNNWMDYIADSFAKAKRLEANPNESIVVADITRGEQIYSSKGPQPVMNKGVVADRYKGRIRIAAAPMNSAGEIIASASDEISASNLFRGVTPNSTFIIIPDKNGRHSYVQAYPVKITDDFVSDEVKQIYNEIRKVVSDAVNNAFAKSGDRTQVLNALKPAREMLIGLLHNHDGNTPLLLGQRINNKLIHTINIFNSGMTDIIDFGVDEHGDIFFSTRRNKSADANKRGKAQITPQEVINAIMQRIERTNINIAHDFIKSDNNSSMVLAGVASRTPDGKFQIKIGNNKPHVFNSFSDFIINNNLVKVNTEVGSNGDNFSRVADRKMVGNGTIKYKLTDVPVTPPVEKNEEKPKSTTKQDKVDKVKELIFDNANPYDIASAVVKGVRGWKKIVDTLRNNSLLPNGIKFNEELTSIARVDRTTGVAEVGQKWMDMILNGREKIAIRKLVHEKLHYGIEAHGDTERIRKDIREIYDAFVASNPKGLEKYITWNKNPRYWNEEFGTLTDEGIEEFFVESLTSGELANYLNSVASTKEAKASEIEEGKETLWQKVMRILQDLLGLNIKDNTLYAQEFILFSEAISDTNSNKELDTETKEIEEKTIDTTTVADENMDYGSDDEFDYSTIDETQGSIGTLIESLPIDNQAKFSKLINEGVISMVCH